MGKDLHFICKIIWEKRWTYKCEWKGKEGNKPKGKITWNNINPSTICSLTLQPYNVFSLAWFDHSNIFKTSTIHNQQAFLRLDHLPRTNLWLWERLGNFVWSLQHNSSTGCADHTTGRAPPNGSRTLLFWTAEEISTGRALGSTGRAPLCCPKLLLFRSFLSITLSISLASVRMHNESERREFGLL